MSRQDPKTRRGGPRADASAWPLGRPCSKLRLAPSRETKTSRPGPMPRGAGVALFALATHPDRKSPAVSAGARFGRGWSCAAVLVGYVMLQDMTGASLEADPQAETIRWGSHGREN